MYQDDMQTWHIICLLQMATSARVSMLLSARSAWAEQRTGSGC